MLLLHAVNILMHMKARAFDAWLLLLLLLLLLPGSAVAGLGLVCLLMFGFLPRHLPNMHDAVFT